jgi:RHS repeat-associated protein
VVRWYRNDTLLYTSTNPTIRYPLVVDSSIYSPGGWLYDAHLCTAGTGMDVGNGPAYGVYSYKDKDRGTAGGDANGTAVNVRKARAEANPNPNPLPTPTYSPTPVSSGSKGQHTGQSPDSGGGRSNTLIYLHTDHLGSVSVATDASGQVLSQQEYDPWGRVRSGGVGQTTLNYTGQRVDSTGLLYYHARYYDPTLARFISPDSIVPGASLGAGGALGTVGMMGQEQSSLLTVDFHEGGLLSGLNGDNALTLQKGYWFQLSGQDRQRAREPWGPHNPQALNRYSYVLDNPVRYVDPSGHAYKVPGDTGNQQNVVLYRSTSGDLVQLLANGIIRIALSADTLKLIGELANPLPNPDPNIPSPQELIKRLLMAAGMSVEWASRVGVLIAAAISTIANGIADNNNHLNIYVQLDGKIEEWVINGGRTPPVLLENLRPANEIPCPPACYGKGPNYCPSEIPSCSGSGSGPCPLPCPAVPRP